MKKPTIVISAANSTGNGGLGCLSVVRDCLQYLSTNLADRFEIVALVHKRELFEAANVTYLEFPLSCRSFLFRLYYEHIAFRRLSQELNPALWFSLVNLTPTVRAKRQAVYCHNPCNLYELGLRELFLQPRFAMYNLLLGQAYALNIQANNYVVVQQDWIRDEFQKRFGVERVIVAHPAPPARTLDPIEFRSERHERFRFFYPAFPAVYKNYEVLIEAARIVRQKHKAFEICLTLDGTESRYARHVAKLCADVPEIRLLGILRREAVLDLYRSSDCLLFPSKLETWGLPITEFKETCKPMLVADLRYAHETVGNYDRVTFFDPENATQLAELMCKAIGDELVFGSPHMASAVAQPFAENWAELFSILLGCSEADMSMSAGQGGPA